MNQIRRKVEINSELWLVTSEETKDTSEETMVPETFSTQKEIKVNEIKVKTVVPEKPAPAKKSLGKKNEEPEPYWEKLVDTWFTFGKEKFGEKPSFDGQDPKIFKRIIQRLKKRAGDKKIEWTEITGPQRLKLFLEMAFSEKWLSENFLLSNLEKQFDKIVQQQSSKKQHIPVSDIDYLFERYCDGQLDHKLILPSHYDELKRKNLVVIDDKIISKRIKSLTGSTEFLEGQLCQDYEAGKRTKLVLDDIPNLQKLSVIQYFKNLKNKSHAIAE